MKSHIIVHMGHPYDQTYALPSHLKGQNLHFHVQGYKNKLWHTEIMYILSFNKITLKLIETSLAWVS